MNIRNFLSSFPVFKKSNLDAILEKNFTPFSEAIKSIFKNFLSEDEYNALKQSFKENSVDYTQLEMALDSITKRFIDKEARLFKHDELELYLHLLKYSLIFSLIKAIASSVQENDNFFLAYELEKIKSRVLELEEKDKNYPSNVSYYLNEFLPLYKRVAESLNVRKHPLVFQDIDSWKALINELTKEKPNTAKITDLTSKILGEIERIYTHLYANFEVKNIINRTIKMYREYSEEPGYKQLINELENLSSKLLSQEKIMEKIERSWQRSKETISRVLDFIIAYRLIFYPEERVQNEKVRELKDFVNEWKLYL